MGEHIVSERLIVVGLTGVAGSGKDTVASILAHRFGFFRIALADGVRAAFRDIDGITWGLAKELEKAGKTSRWALQNMGCEAREEVARASEFDTNKLWCYLAATKIVYLDRIHPVPRHLFVVPDVSYLHEVVTLRDITRGLGGTYQTWRVERPGAGLSGEAAMHSTEIGRATIPADRTLFNNGTIRDLEAVVELPARNLIDRESGGTYGPLPG
jgi:hypothetical protein